MLPTPANLVRWKISEDDKCKCGKIGTLRHILSACPVGLKERYAWRHDQVFQVFFKYMKEKILEINEGKIPTIETREEITFHKEGQRSNVIKSTVTMKKDEKWNGIGKIEADLDTKLVFPATETMQSPDLIVWSEEQRHIITLELTVPWEDNIKDGELRKEQRYEELLDFCVDKGWTTEYYHLAVGCRGFVDKGVVRLLRERFRMTSDKSKLIVKDLQQAAEKSSLFIWLKRDDDHWLESAS